MAEHEIDVTTENGQLFKMHAELLAERPAGESSQASDDPDLGTPNDCIEPPESLERLAGWTSINGVRAACLDAVVRNTVGLGYELEPYPGHEKEMADPTELIAKAKATLEALAARDTKLEKPSFTGLLEAVKRDEEEVGNGYMEVARDKRSGQISGLFHVPGKRVRRLRSRKGYQLLSSSGDMDRGTQFLNFGDKVAYDRKGQPLAKLAEGVARWNVNELLPFKLYTSESRDYGLPRDVALALEYLGDKLAAQSNVSFFDSSGTPPTVLFVQGEERKDGSTIHIQVPAETSQRIASTLRSDGDRGSRVAIIPLPQGAKVQKEVLGQISDRDMGFVEFRDDMRQRTLSAFRLSPLFIALLGDGRYTAEVERAITKEQVFDPEQTRYETRIHAAVLNDLGFGNLALKFRDLAIEDDAARRSSAEKMGETSTITNREYRVAHGYAPLPEAQEGAEPQPGQMPFGWNDELVKVNLPRGAENRVAAGDSQQGLHPGIGGRGTRDKGQADSANRVESQVRRLAGRNGKSSRGGARRALERARALPEG